MNIYFEESLRGIDVNFSGKKFRLVYPHEIWKSFSSKDFFIDNVAYLETAVMPVVSEIDVLEYNTNKPFIKEFLDETITRDIPSVAEDEDISSRELIRKFKNKKYVFSEGNIKSPYFSYEVMERAVICFSSGKDSLLSLGLCDEIGLDPILVYVNDTVSPSENLYKLRSIKDIAKKFGFSYGIVTNELENLNDFEYWNKDMTNMSYSHLTTSFCFLSLPFVEYYKGKYLVLGNERDLDFTLKNEDGIICYPSFDQSIKGTNRLDKEFNKITSGKLRVTSVISPLYDLAIMKILHERYPELAKFQSSCSCLDASDEKRWCYACADCSRIFTYMKALGKDPKYIGIKKDMFDEDHYLYNPLFNKEEEDRYDKAGDNDEMIFSLYLSYKNGSEGKAIDLFMDRYLDYAEKNKDRLYKRFFSYHGFEAVPKELRKELKSLFEDSLKH